MADSGGRAIGRDTSQGPGWWLASDGKWYPPDLSPENRAKKKKRKKTPTKKVSAGRAATSKAARQSATDKSPVAKTASKARPSSAHRGGQVGATTSGPGDADLDDDDGLEFDDDAPPTDQIVARRVQAREQHVLLAGARQEAALRALTSLGVDAEPELVGVGTRSFDARVADAPPLATPPVPPAVDRGDQPLPVTAPPAPTGELTIGPSTTDAAPAPAEPIGAVDELRADDLADAGATGDAPTVEPRDPASDTGDEADEADEADEDDGDEDDEATAGDQVEAPSVADAVPAPHQPTKRPEPASVPMGTEAPFMEVRGSALGTDIERIGEKILIFADRVELRDRGNTTRQTIAYTELARVVIQKKIMGPTLLIESNTGETMTAKALRPELATGAKAMIEKHARRHLDGLPPGSAEPAMAMADTAPAPPADRSLGEATATAPRPEPVAPAVVELRDPAPIRLPHKHVLAAMIDELHAAGILTAEEQAEKLALLDLIVRD